MLWIPEEAVLGWAEPKSIPETVVAGAGVSTSILEAAVSPAIPKAAVATSEALSSVSVSVTEAAVSTPILEAAVSAAIPKAAVATSGALSSVSVAEAAVSTSLKGPAESHVLLAPAVAVLSTWFPMAASPKMPVGAGDATPPERAARRAAPLEVEGRLSVSPLQRAAPDSLGPAWRGRSSPLPSRSSSRRTGPVTVAPPWPRARAEHA